MENRNNKRYTGFILASLAPAVILFIVFMVVPTINVFRMSLYKWGGYSPNKEFVGFSNFIKLFKDNNFILSFQNSLLLIVFVTVITLGGSLVLAGVLTQDNIKGKGFFRVIFYIPNILSIVIISAIFSAIYDPNNGLLNGLLKILAPKAETIYWLGDNKIVVFAIAFAMIWQAIGYYMVMYMSSMASVPKSLYESAGLDGASKIKQFSQITIPLIWSNIRTTLTFFIISNINMSFLFVKAMTDGKPDGSSEVFLSYMYKQAYTNSTYGYGMAIGVVIFVFSFALSAIVNIATKREPLEF